MQRFLLIGLLAATGTLCAAAPRNLSAHHRIAGYAAVVGNNLLAQDIKDERGLLLVRFAQTLHPESEAVLLTMLMLKRAKKPKPIETRVTEATLYRVIASQAKSLRLKDWPRDAKAGQLALLYYRMAERFQPNDKEVMLGLMKLKAEGIEGELDDLLGKVAVPPALGQSDNSKATSRPGSVQVSGIAPKDWRTLSYEGRKWVEYPLSRLDFSLRRNALNVKNTTNHINAIIIYLPELAGDFDLRMDLKGGNIISLQRKPGGGKGSARLRVSDRDNRHMYRITRTGNTVQFWEDARKAKHTGKAPGTSHFSVLVQKPNELELSNFRLVRGAPKALSKPAATPGPKSSLGLTFAQFTRRFDGALAGTFKPYKDRFSLRGMKVTDTSKGEVFLVSLSEHVGLLMGSIHKSNHKIAQLVLISDRVDDGRSLQAAEEYLVAMGLLAVIVDPSMSKAQRTAVLGLMKGIPTLRELGDGSWEKAIQVKRTTYTLMTNRLVGVWFIVEPAEK